MDTFLSKRNRVIVARNSIEGSSQQGRQWNLQSPVGRLVLTLLNCWAVHGKGGSKQGTNLITKVSFLIGTANFLDAYNSSLFPIFESLFRRSLKVELFPQIGYFFLFLFFSFFSFESTNVEVYTDWKFVFTNWRKLILGSNVAKFDSPID